MDVFKLFIFNVIIDICRCKGIILLFFSVFLTASPPRPTTTTTTNPHFSLQSYFGLLGLVSYSILFIVIFILYLVYIFTGYYRGLQNIDLAFQLFVINNFQFY